LRPDPRISSFAVRLHETLALPRRCENLLHETNEREGRERRQRQSARFHAEWSDHVYYSAIRRGMSRVWCTIPHNKGTVLHLIIR
jgi:hypothetical protein